MIYENAGWALDIDVEKTKAYYTEQDEKPYPECSCIYCKNYGQAINSISFELNSFFTLLGIIPKRPAEVMYLEEQSRNTHLYMMIFIVTGRIITAPEEKKKKLFSNNESAPLLIVSEGKIYVTSDLNFPGGVELCPEPILQINVVCSIPWVLEEPPPN